MRNGWSINDGAIVQCLLRAKAAAAFVV